MGGADAADACVVRALDAFGRLDAMCWNAGTLRDRVLWNTTDEDFDAVIVTHLRGTFTCARAAARHWREAGEDGRLVLVFSIAGQRGNFGQTAYSAAKAGIAAMARTWSMELAKSRVTANAVAPNALTRMVATIPALSTCVDAAERGETLPERLRADVGIGTAEDVRAAFRLAGVGAVGGGDGPVHRNRRRSTVALVAPSGDGVLSALRGLDPRGHRRAVE